MNQTDESMPELEILLPVHNEAPCIEQVITEIYKEFSPRLAVRFIISEDGSNDGTKDILENLSREIPIKLLLSVKRKGYSQAVIDGMKLLQAPYLLCLDSDGQCDPKDFWSLWELKDHFDIVMGWRTDRQDTLRRRFMSRTFYLIYRLLLGVKLHDPSCPFIIAKKEVINQVVDQLGEMREGLWWEFVARTVQRGYKIKEMPVHHRQRISGQTKVYKFGKIISIGITHLRALFRIWRHKED
jgi:glycosyltransferase involved in cell wall biosynthesis